MGSRRWGIFWWGLNSSPADPISAMLEPHCSRGWSKWMGAVSADLPGPLLSHPTLPECRSESWASSGPVCGEVPCLGDEEGMRMRSERSREGARLEHRLQAVQGPGMWQQAVVETQSTHSPSPGAVVTRRGIPQQPGGVGKPAPGRQLCARVA